MLEQIAETYGPAEEAEAREIEFFGGIVAGSIKGERQRRLAVLCFLSRESAAKPAGVTVADLERLTGCTREELSSTLWYLREKEWARPGESGEYRITDAGAEVLATLDEREAAMCKAWLAPEQPRAAEAATPQNPPPPSPSASDAPARAPAQKRVILSMGGKGGVGKTSVMTGLAEWFEENRIPVTLLDLDIENKACGSLTHFFGGRVPKINIHTPAGLDTFIDHLGDEATAILADMGAGSGQITYDWFDKMYPDVAEAGVAFTAIGVVTSDPASVASVLAWAEALQDRVSYVIVENHLTEHPDFSYWRETQPAEEFRKRFRPAVVRMDFRLADLENTARSLGVTLGRIASRSVSAAELQRASLVMRAQSYRRRMFAEFDKVKELLLP